MDFIERTEGIYRVKAIAPPAGDGFRATVVVERELRGHTAEAYREEGIEGRRVFDDPLVALSHAFDRAWQVIHRDPSRLAC